MGKYLTIYDRFYIETSLKNEQPVPDIARALGKCQATIYNEINRGRVVQLDTTLQKRVVYSAELAQSKYEYNATGKGAHIKLGNNYPLADFLEGEILQKKHSPYVALENAKRQGYDVNFCLTTLYTYIKSDVFLHLRRKHLKKYRKKKNKDKRICARKYNREHSIDKRDKTVSKRQVFGHWEMDTIVGKQKTPYCCLVLTERKTRYELVRRMAHKTIDCTLAELDVLEKQLGAKFKSVFKSITTDNGVEFAGNGILERSINGGKRFDLYYTHPYASGEKGSVENNNRQLRKFIKKSEDIAQYDDDFIRYVQDDINNSPRKLFEGYTSSEQLLSEIGFLI